MQTAIKVMILDRPTLVSLLLDVCNVREAAMYYTPHLTANATWIIIKLMRLMRLKLICIATMSLLAQWMRNLHLTGIDALCVEFIRCKECNGDQVFSTVLEKVSRLQDVL